ncbi:MAG: hypothetical protein H6696_05575 [Deferribacteres bacterium]|nr:hypothetical protein [candidate division KSB1 bacterium]MCB9501388.1 hypothetical protein [Deferribacteres bacterium]
MQTIIKSISALIALILFTIACEQNPVQQTPPQIIIVLKDVSLSTPIAEDSLNNEFISSLITQLHSGDELYVLAVKEASFAKPLTLLHGKIPQDNDPLNTKSLTAKEHLQQAWQNRRQAAKLQAKQTDIVGALSYCSLLLKNNQTEKHIVILSDMRQVSSILDLRHKESLNAPKKIKFLQENGLMPQLPDVKITVLGAHTIGYNVDPDYYQRLENFWMQFFQDAQADLLAYRADRNWNLP